MVGMFVVASVLLAQGSTQAPAFDFPDSPLSPRVISMGGAGVAIQGDPEQSLNPGVRDSKFRASLAQFTGFGGYNGLALALGGPIGSRLSFGASVRHFDYGDIIEDDVGPGLDGLGASEDALGLQLAVVLLPNLLEVGVRSTHQSATYFDATVSANELEVGFATRPWKDTRFGVVLLNLGGPARGEDGQEFPLRRGWRAGGTWVKEAERLSVAVAADYEQRRMPDIGLIHAGAELGYRGIFFARTGIEQHEVDLEGNTRVRWTVGSGIRLGRFGVSIAVRPSLLEGELERYIGLAYQ